MRVKDLMDTNFPLLTPAQTGSSALKVLAKWGILAAPVVDNNRFVGSLELNSPLVLQLLAAATRQQLLLVQDLMQVDIPVVQADQSITEIVLSSSPFLPVVGPGKDLVGILWANKIFENMRLGVEVLNTGEPAIGPNLIKYRLFLTVLLLNMEMQ
ncbi:MAG: CBS domain-containing protein [Carboxydocellales bacterium]